MTADHPRRWWALGALGLGLLAFGLDVTILNVALPTLATDLHASTTQLQWFSNAYTLVLAAGLLPAGLLGDRFGPKKLLLGALALFGLASVGCACAGSAELLIAARAVLGIGAALLVPLSMSLLNVLFPADERGRAIAVGTSVMAIGIPLGPVLGGWLLDHYWWGSVFLINVPLVAVALAALAWLLPDIAGTPETRFDVPGVLLSSTGLVVLTYGLVEAGERGWDAPTALVPVLIGVVLLTGFAAWLRRTSHPLVDLRLFSSPAFTWGAVLATLASFGLMGAFFLMPQYFQAVNGTDALDTGLRLLPIVGGLLVGVQANQKLTHRLGAKINVTIGFVMIALGLAIGAGTEVRDGYGFIAIWLSLIGIGLGYSLPTAMDVAMGALSPERSGVGSGLLQAMRQVGGTLGVAVMGTVLNSAYRAGVDLTGLPPQAADAARDSAAGGVQVSAALGSPHLLDTVRTSFVDGLGSALWVCVGFSVLAALLALGFLPRSADHTSESEHVAVASG
jgi:DHA2 family multidrug resistance protein-like MFS transporter